MTTTLAKLNLSVFGYSPETEVIVTEPVNPEVYNCKTVTTLEGYYITSI